MWQVRWYSLLLVAGICAVPQPAAGQGTGRPDLGSRPPASKPAADPLSRRAAPLAAGALRLAGDTVADPVPIATLPFSDAGETCVYQDDYDATCVWSATAPDLVYAFTPPADMQLDIDLCGSAYDTKAFLLDQSLNILACNDDYYGPGDPCGAYVSRLAGARVTGGQTVYLVIDGYGQACGAYQLKVTEYVPCVLVCAAGELEGEPSLHDYYEDRFNGGCNSPRQVPPIMTLQADGQGEYSFCGVSGYYGSQTEHRDTDWFAITLGPTGEAVWTLEAEQTTMGLVLALSCPDPTQYGVVVGGPCAPGSLTIVGQPGQAVGLWVGPPGYTAPLNMAGNEYDYQFTLTGLSPHQAVGVIRVTWGAAKSLYH